MPWIAPIQDVTAAIAGRQVAKYNSSVPTGNGMKWGSESGKKLNLNGTGSPYGPQPDNGPLKPLRPYGPQQYSGTLQPLSTLDNLSPRQISNMSLESIQRALPKGWELKNNNGFVHIYDNVNPKPIIRIDPPDSKTNYPHMHFYDGAQNSLDINGKIVDYCSSETHVPWINDQ